MANANDIMMPEIVNINGRCYRVLEENFKFDGELVKADGIQPDFFDDDNQDEDESIEETPNGYKLSLRVPEKCFGMIIGKKGSNMKQLQQDTGTKIKLPSSRNSDASNDLTCITGSSKKGVISAKVRIELLVDSCRSKALPTHFVMVPLLSKQVISSYIQFKDMVLQDFSQCKGIEESIMQEPQRLHITIVVLRLFDKIEEDKAKRIFDDCSDVVSKRLKSIKQAKVDIKGLEIMGDDPSAAKVLYAEIHDTILQELGEDIVDRFVASGLTGKEGPRLKLHATLMNSRYRTSTPGGTEPFDARNILQDMNHFNFGSTNLSNIQLCKMQKNNDGQYIVVSSLPLS
ncbi:Activating signal cointegrator 1 complex subunit 1 [Trichoplax sp. H2]|nr:Activating signal cointegrator 1 complex subunit 1 [Trichoplax sp. H2]|eukprot:RDD38469.1 Activating signal cointegrator 1 complex subunit 1 [Trichoplax sp. H2]